MAVKGKCYRLLYECDKIKTFQIVGTSFALFPLIWAEERIMQPRKGPIQNEFTAYFDREGCIRQIWDRNESGHVWGKKNASSPPVHVRKVSRFTLFRDTVLQLIAFFLDLEGIPITRRNQGTSARTFRKTTTTTAQFHDHQTKQRSLMRNNSSPAASISNMSSRWSLLRSGLLFLLGLAVVLFSDNLEENRENLRFIARYDEIGCFGTTNHIFLVVSSTATTTTTDRSNRSPIDRAHDWKCCFFRCTRVATRLVTKPRNFQNIHRSKQSSPQKLAVAVFKARKQ